MIDVDPPGPTDAELALGAARNAIAAARKLIEMIFRLGKELTAEEQAAARDLGGVIDQTDDMIADVLAKMRRARGVRED